MVESKTSNRALAKRLKQVRMLAGLTQEQLAASSGIRKEYISRIECGALSDLLGRTYKKLAEGLGCDVRELLG